MVIGWVGRGEKEEDGGGEEKGIGEENEIRGTIDERLTRAPMMEEE